MYAPPEGIDISEVRELDSGPIETLAAPPGHPTETPAPYRELDFAADDLSLDAPDPVSATPPPLETWTPRPAPAPVGRPGVAWAYVGTPRDPAETTSEIPPAASSSDTLLGSQTSATDGAGGLDLDTTPPPSKPPPSPADMAQELARLSAVVGAVAAQMDSYARDVEQRRGDDLRGASMALAAGTIKAEVAKMREQSAIARREAWESWVRAELPKFFAVMTAGGGTFFVLLAGFVLVILKRAGLLSDDILHVISAIIEILRVLW